jgi:peptidoglycan/LPS O-acetylase OafA/YrhL
MKKFTAIEGLRGWLAWTVVLSHLAMTSGIYAKGIGYAAETAGTFAVFIFVIISGFVITHLVIERPEPYNIYLLRRFMRIFPLFALTCVMGYFTSDIYAETLSHLPWTARYGKLFSNIAQSDHRFFWAHVLAHLTMLHGAISDTLLPFSQYAFNPPAWSLSLEWQFYLIAPFAVIAAREPRTLVWLAFSIAIVEFAYELGFLGNFPSASFLPGAAGYFALGIASRLAYTKIIGAVRQPRVIFALFLLLIPLGWTAVPLLAWALVFTGLVLDRTDARTESFAQAYSYAMESRIATYFGSRSYSVYLSHMPIIAVCHSLWLAVFPMAFHVFTLLGVSVMVIPTTLIVSELLYRNVERPGMAFGALLADRWAMRRHLSRMTTLPLDRSRQSCTGSGNE